MISYTDSYVYLRHWYISKYHNIFNLRTYREECPDFLPYITRKPNATRQFYTPSWSFQSSLKRPLLAARIHRTNKGVRSLWSRSAMICLVGDATKAKQRSGVEVFSAEIMAGTVTAESDRSEPSVSLIAEIVRS